MLLKRGELRYSEFIAEIGAHDESDKSEVRCVFRSIRPPIPIDFVQRFRSYPSTIPVDRTDLSERSDEGVDNVSQWTD